MPKSLVAALMKQGKSKKHAEAMAMKITNAQKAKKKGKKRKK